MRRLEQRITCEDETGRRYVVEVFANSLPVTTLYGTCELPEPCECWIKRGDCYQPVNVVEPLKVFSFVDHGRILKLHRVAETVAETSVLPSFLRWQSWGLSPRTGAGRG